MKKGFTLIELLAVIVILAIIMVIAVPQILNVIDSSRTSAWNDNAKMLMRAVELDYSMSDTTSVISETICGGTTENFISKLKEIAELDTTATEIFDNNYNASTCTFKLRPVNNGNFSNSVNGTKTIACRLGVCEEQ